MAKTNPRPRCSELDYNFFLFATKDSTALTKRAGWSREAKRARGRRAQRDVLTARMSAVFDDFSPPQRSGGDGGLTLRRKKVQTTPRERHLGKGGASCGQATPRGSNLRGGGGRERTAANEVVPDGLGSASDSDDGDSIARGGSKRQRLVAGAGRCQVCLCLLPVPSLTPSRACAIFRPRVCLGSGVALREISFPLFPVFSAPSFSSARLLQARTRAC